MMASLYAGVSGLKNHQVKMNVIGNNIANINTIGFKAGRVNFQEALVQTTRGAGRPSTVSGGTNPVQLGLGMQVASVDNLFQQGGLETTGQITDLAIQGSGFFILGDNNNNRFYTRAGAFGFDADSTLVDPATGLYVLGRMADATGQIPSLATTGPIQLPFGQQDPAQATELVTLANNLDASATDARTTLESSGLSSVVSVSGIALDGVGGTHSISITGNQATNSVATGANVATDDAGVPIGGLSLTDTLGSLHITDFSLGFRIDGDSTTQNVSGLSATSTIQDVINAITEIEGLTADLVGGELQITRNKAGLYSFESGTGTTTTDAVTGVVSGNMIGVLFGANGSTFGASNGIAHTFVATDTFTPDRGTGAAVGPFTTNLDYVIDENTGIVTGLTGLGGDDSVEIKAGSDGITTTLANPADPASDDPLVISTEPTIHSTSINVYDSQGTKHTLTIEFSKSNVQSRWEWTATMLGNETITVGGRGYVQFNADGSLNAFEYSAGANGMTIEPNNGAETMRIAFDAGTPFEFSGLTQFGSPHTASIIGQDGYGLGILEKISIDKAGNISGIFSNGVTRVLAQIMLADFNNQAGLRKAGRSLYQESANSGQAVQGVAGSTVSGEITSGALEASSVDISQEFTTMITTQRGFQANSRIITTSDSMLDELVNLKR
ncbi:MAG: flagellar hook-basal body complex protein [candidate division Zixibacteria bacterium]|jgi:flagellar hook protein FlgE|nr:flagellar hook-basal body complex protein [candidate division Zixibacteria bacterium]